MDNINSSTAYYEITDAQIEALQQEAAAAGDAAQVAICDLALQGDFDARRTCENVISAAAVAS